MNERKGLVEILRKIELLEKNFNELSELKDSAFKVFHYIPLNEMEEIFETSWRKLFSWNKKHEQDNVPMLEIQNYSEVRKFFAEVTSARINRKEFERALAKSCISIVECIERLKIQIAMEEEILNELYMDFVHSTGELEFIFESQKVKQLIMDKLLRL